MDADEVSLADLGRKVLNAISATERLGHTNLRHTLRYLHPGDDLTARLVVAVIDGRIEPLRDARETWERNLRGAA